MSDEIKEPKQKIADKKVTLRWMISGGLTKEATVSNAKAAAEFGASIVNMAAEIGAHFEMIPTIVDKAREAARLVPKTKLRSSKAETAAAVRTKAAVKKTTKKSTKKK
jgi:hypothetical protein